MPDPWPDVHMSEKMLGIYRKKIEDVKSMELRNHLPSVQTWAYWHSLNVSMRA